MKNQPSKRARKDKEQSKKESGNPTLLKWNEMNRKQRREMMRKMHHEDLSLEVVHPGRLEEARRQGASKAVRLHVSVPSHCPLLQPVADLSGKRMSSVNLTTPRMTHVGNVNARAMRTREMVARDLVNSGEPLISLLPSSLMNCTRDEDYACEYENSRRSSRQSDTIIFVFELNWWADANRKD